MSYLPPLVPESTAFPQALGADAQAIIRQIDERWRRSYPQIRYTAINKQTTPVTPAAPLSGEAGASKFDPLWSESVDATATTWVQPHTDPNAKAADVTVYKPEVLVHARIMRSMRENQLKKIGFDRVRELIVCIPTSMLDAVDVRCQAGDRFTWNNELWEVVQDNVEGWFYNTNVNLYVWLNVTHARHGS